MLFPHSQRIAEFNCLILATTEDDLGFFPKYDAAPVVRQETLEEISRTLKKCLTACGKNYRRRYVENECPCRFG